jgi:hypothetical protein
VAEIDAASLRDKADFARRVRELTTTLVGILSDTSKLQEIRKKSDAEAIQELIWGIARGYQATPDLRLAWLDALAKEHADKVLLLE